MSEWRTPITLVKVHAKASSLQNTTLVRKQLQPEMASQYLPTILKRSSQLHRPLRRQRRQRLRLLHKCLPANSATRSLHLSARSSPTKDQVRVLGLCLGHEKCFVGRPGWQANSDNNEQERRLLCERLGFLCICFFIFSSFRVVSRQCAADPAARRAASPSDRTVHFRVPIRMNDQYTDEDRRRLRPQ